MRPTINYTKLSLLGTRLKMLREAASISQRQIEFVTGMDQSHLSRIEAGQVNVSLNYIFLIADFFGLEDYEILNFKSPIPEGPILTRNVLRFLKKKNIDTTYFFKTGLTSFLEESVISTKFLSVPRYSKEIADHVKEKYKEKFTSSALAQALEGLRKKGLIEKVPTDKKSKFQYRKK